MLNPEPKTRKCCTKNDSSEMIYLSELILQKYVILLMIPYSLQVPRIGRRYGSIRALVNQKNWESSRQKLIIRGINKQKFRDSLTSFHELRKKHFLSLFTVETSNSWLLNFRKWKKKCLLTQNVKIKSQTRTDF